MTDKILDLLKLVLEKWSIPTVLSIPVTIVIAARFPDLFGIKSGTNATAYKIFVFCVVFLLVLLGQNMLFYVKRKYENNKSEKYYTKKQREELEEGVRKLWGFVDGLSVPDRQALMQFLKSNNEPITSSARYAGESIFNNGKIMNCTIAGSREEYPNLPRPDSKFAKNHICMSIDVEPTLITTRKYKLDDGFFALLKYSYDNYHKISNFEEADK